MIRGYTCDFISYLLPKDFISEHGASHHVWARAPHQLNPPLRPSIATSSEPQCGLTLIEPLRPYSLDLNRRSRSNRKKLLIPSTSRTLAARCGAPSTNLLEGLDAPLACAPAQETPSPRNSSRTGYTELGAKSPPGLSTRRWSTNGRLQHLTVTVSQNSLGRRSLMLPSDA